MAKYESPRIAQLYIEKVPNNLSINHFKYKITKKIERKVVYASEDLMFKQNKTLPIVIKDSNEKVQVDVYLNSKWFKGYILKHYKTEDAIKFDKTSFKSTESLNSQNTSHIKDLELSTKAEVGWLMVKKEQTFDSLLRLIYKKVPTHKDLDIFRHANAHLSDLQDLNLNKKIKPGQIILVTNKKESLELVEYKKYTLEAEKIYQILCKNKDFDPVFFANNYEVLMDYFSLANQVYIAKLEYIKTVDGHKEDYCTPYQINVTAEAVNGVGEFSKNSKNQFDELKTHRVNQELLQELSRNITALQKQYEHEKVSKTKLANPKHEADFRKANFQTYQRLEKILSNNFVALKDNKEYAKILKNIVRDTSGVRAPEFMGGLKLSVQRMQAIGDATIQLKLGIKLVFYFNLVVAGTKVYSAYQTGDMKYTMKVVTVESGSLAGGVLGGAALGVSGAALGGQVGAEIGLIFAIPTSGASIPAFSAGGALIGGVVGAVYGSIKGASFGSEIMKDITKICS